MVTPYRASGLMLPWYCPIISSGLTLPWLWPPYQPPPIVNEPKPNITMVTSGGGKQCSSTVNS